MAYHRGVVLKVMLSMMEKASRSELRLWYNILRQREN